VRPEHYSARHYKAKHHRRSFIDSILAIGKYVVRVLAPVVRILTRKLKREVEELSIAEARITTQISIANSSPVTRVINTTPTVTVRDITQ